MIRNRYAVVLAAFCAFGLLGLLFPAVGASLPAIGGAFGPGPARTGLILTAFQLGYTLFCLLGGVLADLAGRRLVLVCGTLLYAAGGLLLGVPPSFEGNLALFVCLGMGSGLIYGSSNTLVIELFPSGGGRSERPPPLLRRRHPGGAGAGERLPGAGRPWSAVYARLGLGAAALAAFFRPARPGRAGTVVTSDGQGDSPLFGRVSRSCPTAGQPPFLLCWAWGRWPSGWSSASPTCWSRCCCRGGGCRCRGRPWSSRCIS